MQPRTRTVEFRTADPGTLRAEARSAGFRELGIYLREAVGAVSVDWRIVNPKLSGRMLRGAQFGWFAVAALVLGLVAFALLKSALPGGD